jgi:hypothetical protein
MPQTKPASQVVEKWQRRAAVASPEYLAGIRNPRTSWADAAGKANENYKQAVTQAANQNRFQSGVQKAGDGKWQSGAEKKGPSRFIEGVQVSGPEFSQKIGEVLQTISSVTLPPRGPKGSPQNYQRIMPIGEALRRAAGKTGAK